MLVTVVGISNVDYVSRKTNKQVKGKTLHVLSPLTGDAGVGKKTDTIYISDNSQVASIIPKIELGKDINVYYNRYGSVDDIQLVK